MLSIALLASLIGLFSASSLPIGSILGLALKPKPKITSALMAFGGGALLFALTIEIMAHSFHESGFLPVATGAITGGLIYEILNNGLNKIGAFFRKTTTAVKYLTDSKIKRARDIVKHLSKVKILSKLPPDDIADIVHDIKIVKMAKGTTVFDEGDPGDSLYMIDKGRVSVSRKSEPVAVLKTGDAFGEMSMLTGASRSATVTVLEDSIFYRMFKNDFQDLINSSPEVYKEVSVLLEIRSTDLAEKNLISEGVAESWIKETSGHLKRRNFLTTSEDLEEAASAHGNAALGIWLGILLDGIPESLVIGISISVAAGTNTLLIPWALIAGVFLANLPEAMSSSVVMKKQKYSSGKILLMWVSIALMTALGAFIGNLFFQEFSVGFISVIEGIAAGAMLTMIAETMLPEAFEQGGTIVGLSTLAGFLAALFIKSL